MKSLKKLLAVALSLAMVLGTMTVTSLAAEGTAITTAAELATALAGSSDCYLANDITLDSTWSRPLTTAAITLDMNGFSIDGNGATDRLCTTASSASKALTISNSSSTVSEIKGFAVNSTNKYLFYVQGGLTIGKNVKITNNTCTNIASTSTGDTAKTITINGEISGNNVGSSNAVITVGSADSKKGNKIVVGSGAKIAGNTCKYDVQVPGKSKQTSTSLYTQTAGTVGTLYAAGSTMAKVTISAGYVQEFSAGGNSTVVELSGGHFGSITPGGTKTVADYLVSGYSCIAPTKQADSTYKYDVVKSDSTWAVKYYDSETEYETLADTKECVTATGFTVADAQEKAGYTFTGWNTKADGKGDAYVAGAEVTYVGARNEEIKLYAQWLDASKTIVDVKYFDGDTELTSLAQKAAEGDTIQAQEAPEKAGYILKEWNTQKNGEGTAYKAGADITLGAENVTLYAIYVDEIASVEANSKTTSYSSLFLALEAAGQTKDATITVLKDCKVLTRGELRYSKDNETERNFVLDLGGKTVTNKTDNGMFIINKNTTVTIKNGTLNSENPKDKTNPYLFYLNSGSTAIIEDGTYNTLGALKGGNGTLTIKGGTFNVDPTEYVAEGYGVSKIDGRWTVAKKIVELVANGVTYFHASFLTAWNYVTETAEVTDATIKLYENQTLSEQPAKLVNGKDVTLDLNGKTVTVTGKSRFVETYGDFTITDTSAAADGAVIYAGTMKTSGYGFICAGYSSAGGGTGHFTLKAGTIKDTSESGYPNALVMTKSGKDADISITGGKVLAKTTDNVALSAYSTITVKNATIEGTFAPITGDTSTAVIIAKQGAVFTFDPSDYIDTNYYKVEADTPEDGYFTVAYKDGLDQIAYIEDEIGEYYTTADVVDAVLAMPNKTGTIVLTGNNLDEPFEIDDPEADITIDFCGNELQPAANSRFINVKSAKSITIKNGTLTANGAVSTAGLLYFRNTQVTLKNFTLNGDPSDNDIQTVTTKKNGTVYLMGCDATFDCVTIKNCKAYDSAAMTGNSGAIHLVRDTANNNKGTTLTMTNCKITNCASAVQGGAISVGSNCVLNASGDTNMIEDCSSANGGAIFVDVANYDVDKKEFVDSAYGVANIDDSLISACEGTGTNSKAPVFSRGMVYYNGILTTSEEVYQDISIGSIDTYSLTLNNDLSFTFVPGDVARTTTDEGKELNLQVVSEDEALKLEVDDMTVSGINLAQMGNEFEVQLFVDETAITAPMKVSVVDYAKKAFAADPTNAKLATLLANALAFGVEAQKYWTDAQGTAFEVPAELAAYVTTDAPETTEANKKATTVHNTTDAAVNKVAYATVNLKDKIAVVFTARSAAGNKLVIKLGNNVVSTTQITAATDGITVYADRISPTQYASTYNAELQTANGTVLHAVQYSVNAYANSNANNNDLGAIVTAMYNFGTAAEAYTK